MRQFAESVIQSCDQQPPFAFVRSVYEKIAPKLELDVYFNFICVEEGKLFLSSYDGVPVDVAKQISYLDFGDAVCGTVAASRTPMCVPDVQHCGDTKVDLVRRYGVRTYFCQPLVVNGELIATLSFGSFRKSEFTEKEIELMQAVGEAVARKLAAVIGHRANGMSAAN